LTREELAPWVWEVPGVVLASRDREGAGDSEGTPPPSRSGFARPISWAALFDNANPVEVEVGMGKGLFLLTEAVARPHVNFFGIEVVRKYQLYAATRYAIRQLPNVKTACTDAKALLRGHIPPGSVSAVHVLFPDPWWKKRHKKRRVFTPEFAADAARVLAVGGRLNIASDVEEYFGVMTGIVGAMPAFQELGRETSTAPVEEAGFQTNFERKARLKGTPVWRVVYERTGEAVTVAADPAASA
jgi:tRNA (guanine-N7-)-methyltransferase